MKHISQKSFKKEFSLVIEKFDELSLLAAALRKLFEGNLIFL